MMNIEEKHIKSISESSILLVDDQRELVKTYQDYLQQHGYVVTACCNGSEALKEFEKNPNRYTLVLTDQMMPEMTGEPELPSHRVPFGSSFRLLIS